MEEKKEKLPSLSPEEVLGILRENKRLHTENQELRDKLTYDAVTGIVRTESEGRRIILEKINATHGEGVRVGLLRLDLDDLKAMNAEFGHEATNGILRGFAQELSSWARRRNGLAMRYHDHGDEFGVLVPVENGEELERTAGELTGFTVKTPKRDVDCTFSLGLAYEEEREVKEEIAGLDKKEGPLAQAGTIFTALSKVADKREVSAKGPGK